MKKNQYQVLGIMSGTSLDGIDVAFLNLRKEEFWSYDIVEAETFAYPREWQTTLGEAVLYENGQLDEINRTYTRYLAGIILDFKKKYNIENLDAVCSHGHTIKHEPQNGFTLQIGNLRELADLIDETVICDFRIQDVKLGGQGAPLVPIGDELLFKDYDYCLNLGGFANISTNQEGKRIAYDICPVNTVLNHLSQKLNHPYDKNGEIAVSGILDIALLERLNSLDYYSQAFPKSLGIEWVIENILPLMENKKDTPSLLHTYSIHAATQIARSFDGSPNSKVLATGGGAFNNFLMEQIRARTKCQLIVPSPEVINYKEALIFGFLGVLKLRNEVNVLGSVTGAPEDHIAGLVYHGSMPTQEQPEI